MQKQLKDETDVTFETDEDALDFAQGAGFHVQNKNGLQIAGRPDMKRSFALRFNNGRWEWKDHASA